MATEVTPINCFIAQSMCLHVQSEVFKQCLCEVNVHYGLTRPDGRNVSLSHWCSYISCENNMNTCITYHNLSFRWNGSPKNKNYYK